MFVIKNKNWFFALSALLLGVSIFTFLFFGVKLGIDFTGGLFLELGYGTRPDISALRSNLESADISGVQIQNYGETNVALRSPSISREEMNKIVSAMAIDGVVPTIVQETNIGPVVGQELKNKAVVAIVIVILAIVFYIAYAFRKSSEAISSWAYGVVAIGALIHDVIIPLGLFSILGYLFGGYEVNALFISAILAILGYSVNDTIIVFDRIRENLNVHKGSPFREVVGLSLRQTIIRSINTSATTFLVLCMLYFMGPTVTKDFAFVLIMGVISGTYSSIFIAPPLLVLVKEWQDKRKSKNK